MAWLWLYPAAGVSMELSSKGLPCFVPAWGGDSCCAPSALCLQHHPRAAHASRAASRTSNRAALPQNGWDSATLGYLGVCRHERKPFALPTASPCQEDFSRTVPALRKVQQAAITTDWLRSSRAMSCCQPPFLCQAHSAQAFSTCWKPGSAKE